MILATFISVRRLALETAAEHQHQHQFFLGGVRVEEVVEHVYLGLVGVGSTTITFISVGLPLKQQQQQQPQPQQPQPQPQQQNAAAAAVVNARAAHGKSKRLAFILKK